MVRSNGMTVRECTAVAVVDDDDGVRDALRFLLEAAGFVVHGYHSALAFLSEAEQYRWRYLVVDQHMPAVTGLELVARLRGRGNRVPTLLITGSVSPDLIDRAAALGVSAVLEKPLADGELLRYLAGAAA
jgi:FixJ family two-component response regulator